MYKLISKSDFRTAFHQCGRGDQFSYEGLGELYDYLEDAYCNEMNGMNGIELDVIALCCDFAEGDVYKVLEQYGLDSIDELEERTIVIWHDQQNAIVLYQQF